MKPAAIFIFLMVMCACCYAQKRDSVFLNANDIQILVNSRNITYHRLDGAPVADSSKKAGATYLMNYLSVSEERPDKQKYYAMLSSVLNSNNLQRGLNKCTILSGYCLQIKYKREQLLLFFSKPGACGNTIEVVKVNTIDKKEATQNYRAEGLKWLE